jgi:hypothetical protein
MRLGIIRTATALLTIGGASRPSSSSGKAAS